MSSIINPHKLHQYLSFLTELWQNLQQEMNCSIVGRGHWTDRSCHIIVVSSVRHMTPGTLWCGMGRVCKASHILQEQLQQKPLTEPDARGTHTRQHASIDTADSIGLVWMSLYSFWEMTASICPKDKPFSRKLYPNETLRLKCTVIHIVTQWRLWLGSTSSDQYSQVKLSVPECCSLCLTVGDGVYDYCYLWQLKLTIAHDTPLQKSSKNLTHKNRHLRTANAYTKTKACVFIIYIYTIINIILNRA